MEYNKQIILPRTTDHKVLERVEKLWYGYTKDEKEVRFKETPEGNLAEKIKTGFFTTFYRAWKLSNEPCNDDLFWIDPFFSSALRSFNRSTKKINRLSKQFLVPFADNPLNNKWFIHYAGLVIHEPILEYRPFGVRINPASIQAEDLFSGTMHKGRPIDYPELDGLESRISQKSRAGDSIVSCIAVEESRKSYTHTFPSQFKLSIKEARKSSSATRIIYVPRWMVPVISTWNLVYQISSHENRISLKSLARIDWRITSTFESVGAIFTDGYDSRVIDAIISEVYFDPTDKKKLTPRIVLEGVVRKIKSTAPSFPRPAKPIPPKKVGLIQRFFSSSAVAEYNIKYLKYLQNSHDYQIELRRYNQKMNQRKELEKKSIANRQVLEKIPLKMTYP